MKTINFNAFYIFFIFSFLGCSQNEGTITEVFQISPEDIYPNANIAISTHSDWTRTHYPTRINDFKANPLAENDIVFIGNSITEEGGDWSDRLNLDNARNRGIAGDTTEGVLARLGEIFYYKPEKVFILIGINDLFHPSMTPESISENIIEIVNQINQYSPNTEIFVQSVLPTTTDSLMENINSVNAILKNNESQHSYQFINLHEDFVLEDGKMDMTLSYDGVHINDSGYQVWTENIINKL
jgi:lysophospholipase L1-like esterase